MTLRVAVVVEGNADGAKAALGATAAGLDQVGGAAKREQSALVAATGAMQAHAAAARMAANTNRQLGFQLNDVAVSLASGMSLPMVAMQQGSQIMQLGIGNVTRSLATMTARFAPLGVAIGAVALGFAGLTNEINKTAATQVDMGDVMQASWQLLSESIVKNFKPVTDWFGGLWDLISPHIANAVTNIIGSFDLGLRNIKTLWSGLPAAIGDVTLQAVNNVIAGTETMINESARRLATLKMQLGPLGGFIPSLPTVDLGSVPNPYAGAERDLQRQMAQNAIDVAGTDYIGLIGKRAQEIARTASASETAGKAAKQSLKAVDLGIKEAAASATQLSDTIGGSLRSAFGSLVSDFKAARREGLDFWQSVGQAGANALDSWSTRLAQMAVDGLLNSVLGAFTGGLGGGLLDGAAGGFSRVGSFSIGSVPLYANGTDHHPGGLAIVGERGPELVSMPPGSRVFSNQQSFGGGSQQVVVHYSPTINAQGLQMTPERLRRVLAEHSARMMESLPDVLADHRRRGRI